MLINGGRTNYTMEAQKEAQSRILMEEHRSAESRKNFDIELPSFADAYLRLKSAFAERKVVITGGRAVNLHTNESTRRSSDVDVIVDAFAGELEGFVKLAESEGFETEDTYNREKGAPGIRLIDKRTQIKFDVYHKGMAPLSGVPIKDILGTAVSTSRDIAIMEDKTGTSKVNFDVAAPGVILIMKFNTWVDRGEAATPQGKDALDFINIMGDQYDNKIDAFIERWRQTIRDYVAKGLIKKPDAYGGKARESVENVDEFKKEIVKMYLKVGKEEYLEGNVPPEYLEFVRDEVHAEELLRQKR